MPPSLDGLIGKKKKLSGLVFYVIYTSSVGLSRSMEAKIAVAAQISQSSSEISFFRLFAIWSKIEKPSFTKIFGFGQKYFRNLFLSCQVTKY